MKVLVTDYAWPDLEIEQATLGAANIELIVASSSDTESLMALATGVDGILTCWAPVPAAVIEATSQCRIVARMGIGLDNIDVQACTDRNIIVTNVPDYCSHEVAEHALALLLALARNVAFFHQQTKSGNYQLQPVTPLQRVSGKTLGIIGWGSIGQQVAQQAQGLGLNVLVTRHNMEQSTGEFPLVPLDDLLANSDFVTLHLPYHEHTHHLLNQQRLALMKPTAFLINTARGGLVDHDALLAALQAGELAGAALDVYDPEPPDLSQPLFQLPQVIATPHAAFYSKESVLELRNCASQQIVACLTGQRPDHVVNPEVLAD